MLGLGETHEELLDTLADLRDAGCDLLTLGQYLQPTPEHLPVVRYVPPEEFDELGQQPAGWASRKSPAARSSARAITPRHGLGRRWQTVSPINATLRPRVSGTAFEAPWHVAK